MNQEPSTEQEEIIYPQLRYTMTTGSGPREESGDYLLNLRAKIVGELFESTLEAPPELHLGEISGTLIRLTLALEENISLHELFDHSHEIHQCASALFTSSYHEYVDEIQQRFPEAFPEQDVLLIRELYIHPSFRGQRLGASVLYRFMTDWNANCSLIAVDPRRVTLQEADSHEKQDDGTEARLKNFLQGLGFQQVGALPYLLLSPTMRQTPIAELALESTLTLPRSTIENLP